MASWHFPILSLSLKREEKFSQNVAERTKLLQIDFDTPLAYI